MIPENDLVDELIDTLTVEDSGENSFTANSPDWFGGHVFGGLIVSQALSAAYRTVSQERPVHSLHGYFLRPAKPSEPFSFTVDRIRDGKSFTTRRVSTYQEQKEIFSLTASFHSGDSTAAYQIPIAPAAGEPDDFPSDPGVWPFEIKDVGPSPAGGDGFHSSTSRMWIRLKKRKESSRQTLDVLLAYISDMTRTGARPPSLGQADSIQGLISLDHAVWFHKPLRPDEWLFYDIHVLVHAGGRGIIRGTIHSREGELGLSMAQELLIRPAT